MCVPEPKKMLILDAESAVTAFHCSTCGEQTKEDARTNNSNKKRVWWMAFFVMDLHAHYAVEPIF